MLKNLREQAQAEKPKPTVSSAPGNGSRLVVYVDEDPGVLANLRRLLEREPYELRLTRSAAEALAWVAREQVHLVIADTGLSGMSGTDLLEKVREHSPVTCRVLVTGFPYRSLSGGDGDGLVEWLIGKPWNDEGLRLLIRQLLDKRYLWTDAGAARKDEEPSSAGRNGSPVSAPGVEPIAAATEQLHQTLERRLHEETVSRLESIVESSEDAIICTNREGEIVGWNASAERIYGFSAGDIQGRPILLLVPSDRIEEARANSEKVARGERVEHFESVHLRKDGTPVHVSMTLSPLRDAEGQAIGEAMTVRDISDRKRMEEQLREKTQGMELAMEGISLLDPEGRFHYVNRAFAQMLGYLPQELIGLGWVPTVHPEDQARAVAAHRRMLTTGKAWFEARAVRQDGSTFPEEVMLVKARDEGKNFVGHYCFLRDVSERKEAEQERDRVNAQLLQGQKLQALGQLSAGIAHEINNPIAFMLSNLATMERYCQDLSRMIATAEEAVRTGAPSRDVRRARRELAQLMQEAETRFVVADLKKAVEESRQGGERIRDIVHSLKSFSHVDVGERKAVDLHECLEQALRICWNELKYKAKVERDYGKVPPVPCYPQQLGQVFMNLFVNAAEAIDEKGKITISTRAEQNAAVVRIRDTGCGIPPGNLKRIFEPFFTTKPVGKGTGLGLHVAYKILEVHGGQVEVRSEVGAGTEFTVRLPLGEPVEEAP